ncbi:hypothetical protein [Natrarchaeobius oligotrophus]|nr:hypothetical protein [Natrarchaeobius chitinivorans]
MTDFTPEERTRAALEAVEQVTATLDARRGRPETRSERTEQSGGRLSR